MTSLRSHCQASKQISLCPHIFTPTWKIFPGACAWLSCKTHQLHGFYSSLGTKQIVDLMRVVFILFVAFYPLSTLLSWIVGCELGRIYGWQTSPELSWECSSCCPIQDGLNPMAPAQLERELMEGSPQLLGGDLQLICVPAQSSPDLCPSWTCWRELQPPWTSGDAQSWWCFQGKPGSQQHNFWHSPAQVTGTASPRAQGCNPQLRVGFDDNPWGWI